MLTKSIIVAMLLGAASTAGSIAAQQLFNKLTASYQSNSAKVNDIVENIRNVFKNVKTKEI